MINHVSQCIFWITFSFFIFVNVPDFLDVGLLILLYVPLFYIEIREYSFLDVNQIIIVNKTFQLLKIKVHIMVKVFLSLSERVQCERLSARSLAGSILQKRASERASAEWTVLNS